LAARRHGLSAAFQVKRDSTFTIAGAVRLMSRRQRKGGGLYTISAQQLSTATTRTRVLFFPEAVV